MDSRVNGSFELKCFGIKRQGRTIVQPFEAEVQKGSCVAIIGKNGVGKSTLLSAMARVQFESSVMWLDAGDKSTLDATQISWLPQKGEFHPQFRADEVILLGRFHKNTGIPSQRDMRESVQVIQDLKLSTIRHRAMQNLSGGEQQRVLLARALAGEGLVTILDEPFASLDMEHSFHILQDFQSNYCQKTTLFYALHNLYLLQNHRGPIWTIDRDGVVGIYQSLKELRSEDFKRLFGVEVETLQSVDSEKTFLHFFAKS